MSNPYDDISARIAADKAYDKSCIDQETLEGGRADIVAQILDIAERWRMKAEDWEFEEQYCNTRASVCEQILTVLHEHLWEDEEQP